MGRFWMSEWELREMRKSRTSYQKQGAERIRIVKFVCVCGVSVCLVFFLLREVWLGTVGRCWINLSVPFPSLSPMLSLRTCHTVPDHTVKHHTVFEKYLACLGMLYEIRQDVASCREHVLCARLASCACLSRGRECISEEHSCSQLPSTPLYCSREMALGVTHEVYRSCLSLYVDTKGPWWWEPLRG